MLKKNDTAWIVENNLSVREVRIVNIFGNLITIQFDNTVIRLPKHRIYENCEEAINSIKFVKPKQDRSNPYDYWH